MHMIHPTAVVEDGASLGEGCEIMAHAVVTRHAILGDRVVVHPGAVVGGDPQYLKFDRRTPSFVQVGDDTVIRENVTLNRSIHEGGATKLGARCFFMAGSHAGHDCVVADDVVLANNALLAGHVEVGAFTFVGGGAAVHQFVRIGGGVMVGGLSRITRDLAPCLMVAERDEVAGLNLVGLRRRGAKAEAVRELKAAYRAVFFGEEEPRAVAARLLAGVGEAGAEVRRFLEFFAGGKRGFARPRKLRVSEGGDAAPDPSV